jgi:exopolysaccharide production protein ExoQ
MPPIVATIVYLAGVAYLFRRDFRERPNITAALWLPFFWVVISGGRFISEWMGILGLNFGSDSVEEGSPIDAIIFFILIGTGVHVLFKRRIHLSEFIRNNRWVTIYLLYCLMAILWSDFPLVAFKRWIKLFGQPVMVLIVLTEPDPMESLARLLKRCAYVLVPVSILFIKYYPDLGRTFDTWVGMPMNTGITTNKNQLGCDCFILGLFFIWHFLRVWRGEKEVSRRNELFLCVVFFVLIGWLLTMAQSSTSLGALVLAAVTMLILGLKFVDRRRIGVYLMAFMVVFVLAEMLFGIHNYAIQALGRNSTFTGRTDIWQILLHWDINPVIGVGFESFWLGEREEKISNLFSFQVNEAHNGYLETYLNLGLLGIFITIALLFATYLKAGRALLDDFDFGRFRLAYLAAFIVYNWTEAAFRTHCFPFFMFFLIAIDYPRPILEYSPSVAKMPEVDEESYAATT